MECCMTRCVSCCMSCDWILANTHTVFRKENLSFSCVLPAKPDQFNQHFRHRAENVIWNEPGSTVLSACSCLNHDTCYQPPQCCVLWAYNFSRNNVIMVTVIIRCLLQCSPVLSVIVGRYAYCLCLGRFAQWTVEGGAWDCVASDVQQKFCYMFDVDCRIFCYSNIVW